MKKKNLNEVFENIPCLLCGSGSSKVLYEGVDAPFVKQKTNLVQCRECGLQYLNPLPKDVYFQKGYEGADESGLYDAEPVDRYINFRGYLAEIEKYKKPPCKILDIGCCKGYFLKIARDNGWDAWGLEPSKKMAEYCRSQGFKTAKGTILASSDLPSGSFDVVTLWDVIEHLRNPVPEFAKINGFLKKKGIVCFWTKDISSIRAKLMGRRYPFIASQHIIYFSPKTVDILMKKTGFRLLEIRRPALKMTVSRITKRMGIKSYFINRVAGGMIIPVSFRDNMLVLAEKV